MYKVKGKYNTACVYASTAEASSVQQIQTFCDMEHFQNSHIAIMPDVHAGAGCTIGTTMTIQDAVIPNMVGVDIGCGMETIVLNDKEIDFEKLDAFIKANIPCGREIRKQALACTSQIDLTQFKCQEEAVLHLTRAQQSIGTLGGGNHFIEVDKDEEGTLYLVIHSGSRYLGKEIAEFYQKKAYQQLNQTTHEDIQKVIDELKAAGRQNEIEGIISQMHKQIKTDIPEELAYCTGKVFTDYIADMKLAQEFAMLNRKAMAEIIAKGLGLSVKEQFTTVHNYIDTQNMILRKGSVSAQKGEKLLIPINMRDGSLICIGKGNPDWNYSAPHGAGRQFSRKEAKNRFDLDTFKKEMEGIYSTTVVEDTLDESPMAYKDMQDIVDNIKPTADIIKVIKPIYNFKAAE